MSFTSSSTAVLLIGCIRNSIAAGARCFLFAAGFHRSGSRRRQWSSKPPSSMDIIPPWVHTSFTTMPPPYRRTNFPSYGPGRDQLPEPQLRSSAVTVAASPPIRVYCISGFRHLQTTGWLAHELIATHPYAVTSRPDIVLRCAREQNHHVRVIGAINYDTFASFKRIGTGHKPFAQEERQISQC